jgi:hypothetical protein
MQWSAIAPHRHMLFPGRLFRVRRSVGCTARLACFEVTSDGVYRRLSRLAAVAFFLVAIYTLAVKVPRGEFGSDWAHTVIHVATGVFAAYAGWIAVRSTAAVVLTWSLAVGYGALGTVGWFIEGLLMGATVRVPLATADNVFHLLLAAAAVAAIVTTRARAAGLPPRPARTPAECDVGAIRRPEKRSRVGGRSG